MTVAADDLTPPGRTEPVSAERVLVIAPHYDDETLGCGGLLIQLSGAGAEIHVLFLSDGTGGAEPVDDRESYARERRAESRRAGEILGVARFHGLRLPDGQLASHRPEIVDGIRAALRQLRPDAVLVPSPQEVSADHRVAFEGLHDALTVTPAGKDDDDVCTPEQVLLYEINRPQHPNLLVDVSSQLDPLREAIECYRSQLGRHPYLQSGLGLRRFRTLTLAPGIRAAEAYRCVAGADLRSRAAPGRTRSAAPSATGEDAVPSVSVIVRTKDRPAQLAEALESIAACRYPELEVVLVNDGGVVPAVRADYPVPVLNVQWSESQGRSAAARAGVEKATGRYVAFLDDDDLLMPHHFETLVPAALRSGSTVVYSDAVVGIYSIGPEGSWRRVDECFPYQRDFDLDLLLIDNYIPLNTVLVERETLLRVGSFDPALDLLEDWDTLLRLAEQEPFVRVATVTCEYRRFVGAAHALSRDPRTSIDYLDARERVFDRHLSQLTPAGLGRAVDVLKSEAAEMSAERDGARTERDAARAERDAARAERDAARAHHDLLRGKVDRLRRQPVGFLLDRLRHRIMHR